jgi:hypothetical protein
VLLLNKTPKMILPLKDQIGKILNSCTVVHGLNGQNAHQMMNVSPTKLAPITCGHITVNLNLLLDAGIWQFAQETELSGCSMKEPSSFGVMKTPLWLPKEWMLHST